MYDKVDFFNAFLSFFPIVLKGYKSCHFNYAVTRIGITKNTDKLWRFVADHGILLKLSTLPDIVHFFVSLILLDA
jgi:3-methyladenine DNA glycosylase Mpg